MERYSDVVQNENGRAVPGASILIVGENGQPATIFSDRQGTPLGNPFNTDSLGRLSFCAADGIYSARVYVKGVLKATLPYIRLEDPDDGFASLASVSGASLIGMLDGRTVQAAFSSLTPGGGGVSVSSVNGVAPNQSGAVMLSTDDLPEESSPTNLWFLPQRVRDVALAGLSVATNAAITAADTVLSAPGKLQAQISALATALSGKQDTSAKDASGGYAGLTAFGINIKNAAGAITSSIVSAATAARTYTLPDKSGTVAMISDIPAAQAGGAWVLLGQATVSTAVANIDFLTIFTSAYDRYRIEINDYAPTANGELAMQVASGGSVGVSTQYSTILTGNTGAAALGQSSWPLGVGILSAAAFRSPGAVLELSGASTSVSSKSLKVSHAFISNASPVYRAVSGIGLYDTNPVLSGFRLLFTNGTTFKFGTVRVYGLKNS